MSYSKRQMSEALDALDIAAEEEGYPFEEMDDNAELEAPEGNECGAQGMQGRCSCVDGQETN